MSEYLRTVSALRSLTGWSWVKTAVFVYSCGPHMALRSVGALRGIEERAESVCELDYMGNTNKDAGH